MQSDNLKLLRDLEQRVRSLEHGMADYRAITGSPVLPDQTIVPVMTSTAVVVGSQTFYTIVFASQPGEQFEAQSSTDLETWTTLTSPIPAAAAPAISSSWTSGGYTIDQQPVYFRIRRFPVLPAPCPSPAVCPA